MGRRYHLLGRGHGQSPRVGAPVQRYQQMADYERLLNRINALREGGGTLAEVGEQLNREGFRSRSGGRGSPAGS